MNTVSPHSPQIQPEVLYGTDCFQVRLWTLEAGAVLNAFPIGPVIRSRNFLLRGQLSANGSGLGAPRHLSLGELFEIGGDDSPCQLENMGQQAAILLEVCQSNNLEYVPLQDVTEVRPWGSFTVLKDEPDYKLKQLMAKPGNRLSLQRHEKREEHWLIIAGKPEITLDDRQFLLEPGDYIKVPRHSWHRLANPAPPNSVDNVEIIELQLGAYFGEDDIERREDDYGRV